MAGKSVAAPQISLDQRVFKRSPAVVSAWLVYGATRAEWVNEKFARIFPGPGPYRHTFEEEVDARLRCAEFWGQQRGRDPGATDPYLNLLLQVHQAAFIREYVWTYLRDPSWKRPSDLRLPAFDAWRKTNLAGHVPETLATLK